MKLSKCQFAKNIVIFLRHQLQAAGIKSNLVKIEAIWKMKAPVNISEVRRFLELTFYY
jgi:hypothetical protein